MKYISLADKLIPKPGYKFDEGVGCTYSADDIMICQLRLKLCADVDSLENFDKNFTLMVQKGKYSGSGSNIILEVSPENGHLHSKLYAVRYKNYKNADDTYYRVLISSANLTNSYQELNCYACFDSITNGGKKIIGTAAYNVFHEAAKNIISCIDTKRSDRQGEFIENLKELNFNTNAELFIPKNKKSEDIVAVDGNNELVIISPFLSDNIIRGFANKAAKLHLITRDDSLSEMPDDIKSHPNISFYGISSTDDRNKEDNISSLHAKMYITKDTLYLGSANATYSGFFKNIETLVKIPVNTDIDKLLKNFKVTDINNLPEPDNTGLKDFEQQCEEWIQSFSTEYINDKNIYTAAEMPKDYAVTLKSFGKELQESEPNKWQEQKTVKHTVTAVINNMEHEKTIFLSVDGDDIPFDKDKMWNDLFGPVNNQIRKILTNSTQNDKNNNTSDTGFERANNRRAVNDAQLLTSLIYRIKSKEQADQILELIDKMIPDKMIPTEINKDKNALLTKRIKENILSAYPQLNEGESENDEL